MSCSEPKTITAAEIVLLHHAVRDLVFGRRLSSRPYPRGFDALLVKLAGFVGETKSCAVQSHSASSSSEELIDTNDAAAILKCSPQYVRRIRERLGVREIGTQRVFRRQAVVRYAERKAGQRR
ncbi:helix-turn-helix domain-containing protein [Mycobacterium sp. SMC-8]|uniref:helix-turn-helix domain-containing protein n=1 Tax=Mycobacterium sp. SMC-8 TaxID=2857060 RepID=UPI0037C62C01